jgi:TrmH family RNA methyltransferase
MLTHAAIQRLRALRDRKHREAEGRFVVEGDKIVAELVAAGYAFEEIYATPAWKGPVTVPIGEAEMARISHFPTPSSVLAVGRIRREPLLPGALDHGLTLALDGVQDPGNVGTLLRIADWFALDRVLLSPDCADLHSAKVVQASMGSFARVPCHSVDLPAALAGARAPIVGCALRGQDLHVLPPLAHGVIVIGSEGRGLSAAVNALLTQTVTIPRYGRAESLNAAVAAAIVCDHVRRRTAAPYLPPLLPPPELRPLLPPAVSTVPASTPTANTPK